MKVLFANVLLSSVLLAQAPPAKAPATKASGGSASLMNPAAFKAKAPDEYKVQFTTSKGTFTITVHRDWAPLGADRFYNLVRAGYFNNLYFFRAIPNFMVQFGMSGNPAVNAVWEKANIKDDPVKESNKRGYITFATAGPNTRTTQLFINLKDNAFLDSMGFAPFGEVTDGMDVVDKLYTGYGDPPRGPDQGKIATEGNAYLAKNFPQLDMIKSAKIVP